MKRQSARIVQGGECGKLIRAYDWADTSMGPIETWPAELIGVVNSMLNSPVAVVLMCGPKGHLIYNNGYAEFAGEKHPRIMGLPFAEAWPEIADYNQEIHDRVKSGELISYQNRLLHLTRKGVPEDVYLDLHYGPILNTDGSFCGTQVWVFETTDRVLAQQDEKKARRLAANERKHLQAMFSEAPAYIAVLGGPDHVYEFANPEYLQLIGKRNIIGKSLRKALPELKSQGIYEVLDKVYATGEAFIGNEISLMLDTTGQGVPEQLYLNFTVQPRYDQSNRIDGVFVYATNVTDLVLSKINAMEVSALNQAITNNSSTALFIVNTKGLCTFMNPAAEQLTGVPRAQAVGRIRLLDGMLTCAHTRFDKTGTCLLIQAIESGTNARGEDTLYSAAGNEFSAASSVDPIVTDGSTSTLVEVRDITAEIAARLEQERLKLMTRERNELRKLNQSKDEFIGMASHQLRTPATTVKQYISLLTGGYGGEMTSQQQEFAEKAYTSNERQLNIINDMLKIAQIDSDRYSLHPANITIGQLVDRAAKEMESTLANREQRLVISNEVAGTVAYLDPGEMNLVLVNLLENASKYSPHRTTIHLTTAVKDGLAVFSVADQGVGIGPEDRKRIFSKFTRVDNALSDTVNGTGLGLYLVNQIVRLHNGSITVRSKPGVGSTFTCKIPYGT